MNTSSNHNHGEKAAQILQLIEAMVEVLADLKVYLEKKEINGQLLEKGFEHLKEIAQLEAALWKLSPRETEVWQLKRQGATYKEVSEKLHISINTVKRHFQSIHRKQELRRGDS